MLSHVRASVGGWLASAFQKLFTRSVFRVAMMSSKTARTAALASPYSISFTVAIIPPRFVISVGYTVGRRGVSDRGRPARRQELRYAKPRPDGGCSRRLLDSVCHGTHDATTHRQREPPGSTKGHRGLLD